MSKIESKMILEVHLHRSDLPAEAENGKHHVEHPAQPTREAYKPLALEQVISHIIDDISAAAAGGYEVTRSRGAQNGKTRSGAGTAPNATKHVPIERVLRRNASDSLEQKDLQLPRWLKTA